MGYRPLLGMGLLFIAQHYITEAYPEFGSALAGMLVVLLVTYNCVFTFWPAVVSHLPWTASQLQLTAVNKDLEMSLRLDTGPAKAKEALTRYLRDVDDTEAAELEKELDALVAKRKQGKFDDNDSKRERDVLDRYQHLVQNRSQLMAIIQGQATNPTDRQRPSDMRSIAQPDTTGRNVASPSILNGDAHRSAEKPVVAVFIESGGSSLEAATQETLYRELQRLDSRMATDIFNAENFGGSAFEQSFRGNRSVLDGSRVFSGVDYVLLGKLATACRESEISGEKFRTCEANLDMKIFDSSHTFGATELSATGAGATDVLALRQALAQVAGLASQETNQTTHTNPSSKAH